MIETYHSVRCDRCSRQADVAKGEQAALEHAALMGYTLNVDDRGTDLCRACTADEQSSGSSEAGEQRV